MDRDKNLAAYMQGSHAVDEAGNPLRLYHGTADDFSEFRHEHPNKKDAGWLGKGFYFSNSPAMANSYAMLKPGKAENVMPVHLSLRNPFYATMEHKTALKNALLDNPYAAEEFRNQLIEAGHDGVILDYGTKDNVKEYVAFHPTQIKSATGNQGTFDPSNPDITKADGGEVIDRATNFAKWFGRSKLVDQNGNPMVLYHGTDRDFSKFNPRKHGASDHGWYGVGHYLTADPSAASAYSAFRGSNKAISGEELHEGANVMPVHARLENPYIWPENRPAATSMEESIAITRQLMNMGYDGVIAPNYYDDGPYASHHEVVVFRPHQIKSATGNNGDYSPIEADITKADGGDVEGYIPHDDPRRDRNFQKWFGKSTAIDGENNPWVHYHITAGNFSKFVPGGFNPKMSGPAIWLTPNKKEQPAGHNTVAGGEFKEGTNVMPLYVKIEKPLFVDETDPEGKARLQEQFGSKSFAWPMTLHPEDIQKMKDAGYDGIYHMQDSDVAGRFNPETGEGLETIVFHPSQVKSAIGNDGGFRPHEEDITKADGGALTDDEGLTAYHGSPHDFEQFDVSKIGMGEGNQAYGHGLYFAQNEKVAKNYRDMLAPEVPSEGGTMADAYSLSREQHAMMDQNDLDAHFSDIDDNSVEKIWRNGKITHFFDDGSALVDEGDHLRPVKKGKGHMYEVHIKAHPDHFLDWDEVLEDQSDHIKNALRRVAEHDEAQIGYSDLHDQLDESEGYTGGAFYETLADRGRAKEASEIFKQMGIKGIRYKDAGSRIGNEEPTHNYVVFDHDHVSVRRKYKQGGAV